MKTRISLGAALAATLVAAACGSNGTSATADPAPTRTEPYLVMSDAANGIAVWPSGDSWLLLSTQDGFAHVTNRTPQGVDTDGGLAVASAPDHVVAIVGAHERLVRSPVLTAGSSWRWNADELPGAVSDSRSAVSALPQSAVSTARRGTLEVRTASGWKPLTNAAALHPGLQLDAVTWANSHVGWLTGTATSGAAAYATNDGGATWSPVTAATGKNVAALPACGAGQSWLLPVIDNGSMQVLRTSDAGLHWTSGAALPRATPVFGCSGSIAWALAKRDGAEHLMASSDGGASWHDRGTTPADVVDVCPAGADGYATTDDGHAVLWRVSGGGSRFTKIALPNWVATIGEQMSDDS